MRLGVSGTHGVGKTTLVEDLGERLGDHRVVPEPFYVLEEEGYHFSSPPSAADYRTQLRRSLLLLGQPDQNIIFFDRAHFTPAGARYIGRLLLESGAFAF